MTVTLLSCLDIELCPQSHNNPHNNMNKKIAMAGAMLLSKRPLEAHHHQPSDLPGLENEENPELPDIGPECMLPAKRPRSDESESRQGPPQTHCLSWLCYSVPLSNSHIWSISTSLFHFINKLFFCLTSWLIKGCRCTAGPCRSTNP